jgi:hypothetical protein
MSKLTIVKPEIGKPDASEDPKLINALTAIETWANGQIDSTNLKGEGVDEAALENESVAESKLTKAARELLNNKTAGGTTKKSIITAEQSRENPAFGVLPTPDEVEVVLPENGLLIVGYKATWRQSIKNTAAAAIFIDGKQLALVTNSSSGPLTQESILAGPLGWVFLSSFVGGLVSSGLEYTNDVTTGQVLGSTLGAGMCTIFGLPAGAHKISVMFAAAEGKVTAKNRKLWAYTIA